MVYNPLLMKNPEIRYNKPLLAYLSLYLGLDKTATNTSD